MKTPEGSTLPRLDVIGLAKAMVRRTTDTGDVCPLYDLALDTAIADDQVASFTRAGRQDAAANWAGHRDAQADALFEAVVSTVTRERADRTTVDAVWHAGLVDAVRRAHAIAARDLGPEHAELLTWLDRARDCARAA